MDDCLLLDAGSGGRASQRLIAQCFMRHFTNPLLERMDDAALLTDISGPLAMSTDSYTVTPLFFAGGSITDPQKRYHLELTTSHLQVSRELGSLLQECGYPPKSLSRGGSLITYFKQSDQIEDFLTLIGAPVAAMSVMSAKLEKDLRNSVNRRLNCDSANLDKAVEAAQEQLESIRKLQRAGLLDQLPDKLQETAALRLEYPELSLSELAAEFDPPVSKSCLNHRLRKLLELSRDLSE